MVSIRWAGSVAAAGVVATLACATGNALLAQAVRQESPRADALASNYLVLNLTVQERDDKKTLENPGGQEMMNNWGGEKSGLPFYVFLDQAGRKIADSNAMPDGTNVGFPGNARELQVFLGLLDKTAPHMNNAGRAKIVGYLNRTVKP